MPVAYSRSGSRPSGSVTRMFARCVSGPCAAPRPWSASHAVNSAGVFRAIVSPMFDDDATEINIRVPSLENTTSRVVCPPVVSLNLGITTWAEPDAIKSPFRYGIRTAAGDPPGTGPLSLLNAEGDQPSPVKWRPRRRPGQDRPGVLAHSRSRTPRRRSPAVTLWLEPYLLMRNPRRKPDRKFRPNPR